MVNRTGTNGNDVLLGTFAADRLDGRGGNDGIKGYAGNDVLIGGAGDDTMRGAPGNDSMRGDAGADNMSGDAGADSLWGGLDNDRLYGEGGDRLYADGGNDSIGAGNCGSLQVKGWGGTGHDTFGLGEGARGTFLGQDGQDWFHVEKANSVTITGGAEKDTYWIEDTPSVPSRTTITDYQSGVDQMHVEGPDDSGSKHEYFMEAFDDNRDGLLTRDDGVSDSNPIGEGLLGEASYRFTDRGLDLSFSGADITLVGVERFEFGDWG
jgi:Ca2+-binding RTX toxin-like protein